MVTPRTLKFLAVSLLTLTMVLNFPLVNAEGNAPSLPNVYKISLMIVTTSDWTTVSSDEINFLSSKVTVLQGESVSGLKVWQYENKIGINKPPFDTTLVKVNVTLIISLPKCSNAKLKIEKGDIGYTYVKVINLNSDTSLLVGEFNNSQAIPGDPTNLRVFPLSCEKLKEGGPLNLPTQSEKIPKMVWAFYYPWYYSDQWDKDPTLIDIPLLGKYSSADSRAIRAHIQLAKAIGIDGFIVSWWGGGTYTDNNLKKILMIASEEDFNVTIYFESLKGNGEPRSPAEIKNMLKYFLRTYGNDTRYFHLWGKPVVFVWATESHSVSVWKGIFEELREEGYDAVYIANTLNPQYLEIFDGLHTYATIKLNLSEAYFRASLQCKTYPLLDQSPKTKIWAATISPGYDDRHVPGRNGYVQPRMNGKYYLSTFEAAIKSDPDWVLITTFNEFPENTFIEPSQKYGFKYALMTVNFTAKFKGMSPNLTAILELEKKWNLREFAWKPPTATENNTGTHSSTTSTQNVETTTTPAPSTTTTSPAPKNITSTPASSTPSPTISQVFESPTSTGAEGNQGICGTGVVMPLTLLPLLVLKVVRKEQL